MDLLLLTKLLASLILPPGGIVVLLVAGLALRPLRPRLGMALVVAGTAALYLLSTGPVARALVEGLERHPPLTAPALADWQAEALVVLGGGRREHAPELGGETVSPATLERLRYAARLHRASGLPIAVTGGVVFGDGAAEAELMAAALREDFGVPVRWVEGQSRNTEQNALFTRRLLERHGVIRIVLVSHAVHLTRAARMFRDQGFEVLEAPTAFLAGPPERLRWRDWIPSRGALNASGIALHERLGRLWYLLRSWVAAF